MRVKHKKHGPQAAVTAAGGNSTSVINVDTDDENTKAAPLKQAKLTRFSSSWNASQLSNEAPISSSFAKKLDEAALQAIVIDGRPFMDFMKPGIQRFLKLATPGYTGPRRQWVAERINSLFIDKEKDLKDSLKDIRVINFTLDLWSDSQMISYLVITAHYFDNDFELNSTILLFQHFKGRHLGK
jgi:vesicle coat complex subunit